MLITKEVEVTLGVRNIRYYENLGYKIPKYEDRNHNMCVKRGTKINVKIEDLSEGSNVNVEYECDNCHKIFSTRYDTYSKHNDNGRTICPYCIEAPHVMKGQTRTRKVKFKPRVVNIGKLKDYGNNRIRTNEYIDFVKKVLKRDSYECQCCHKSDDLEVHHLDGYNWCIEKRTDDTNGITLCKNCHTNFHIKYGRGNNTKEQYEEWIGYAIGDLEKYDGELPTAKEVFDYERNEIYESAESYSKIYGVNASNVRACCSHKNTYKKIKGKDGTEKINKWTVRTVNGHHLFWLDEYEKMSAEELNKYIYAKHKRYKNLGNKKKIKTSKNEIIKPKYKTVICITTGELFQMLKDGGEKYNIKNPSNISECCTSKKKSAGKLSDGTPLKWMFYDDFLKLPIEEQNEILSRNQESSNDGSFIM